jgi:hypothetical protein
MNNESFLCEPYCVCCRRRRRFTPAFCFASELCAWFDAGRCGQRSIQFLLPLRRLGVTGAARRTDTGVARLGKQSFVRDVNASSASLFQTKITPDAQSDCELLLLRANREKLRWIVILPTF